MKISTRGRYGVRLLIDLAEHSDEPHVSLAVVGERQNISARYLEQVAVILKRNGYIRSVKGASGGYTLSMDPSSIVIGDVLRVLEGDIFVVDPLRPGQSETPFQKCIRVTVYERLNERVSAVLDRMTLTAMMGTDDPDASYMYFI